MTAGQSASRRKTASSFPNILATMKMTTAPPLNPRRAANTFRSKNCDSAVSRHLQANCTSPGVEKNAKGMPQLPYFDCGNCHMSDSSFGFWVKPLMANGAGDRQDHQVASNGIRVAFRVVTCPMNDFFHQGLFGYSAVLGGWTPAIA